MDRSRWTVEYSRPEDINKGIEIRQCFREATTTGDTFGWGTGHLFLINSAGFKGSSWKPMLEFTSPNSPRGQTWVNRLSEEQGRTCAWNPGHNQRHPRGPGRRSWLTTSLALTS